MKLSISHQPMALYKYVYDYEQCKKPNQILHQQQMGTGQMLHGLSRLDLIHLFAF